VVLVEDTTCDDATRLAKTLAVALTSLPGQIGEALSGPGMDIGHVGVACYTGKQRSGILLSMADTALRQAETDSANGWAIYDDKSTDLSTRTATQWRQYIGQALEEDWLVVQRQPVFNSADRSILHEEVYVRLADNGDMTKLLNAGAFMPMAQSLGMATSIDRRVIEKVLGLLHAEQEGQLAVNISPLSLDSSEFINWLKSRLARNREEAKRLILEFPEYGVVKKLDKLCQLNEEIRHYGVQLSLDHFGRGFTSFAYLQSIKLHYLKIDGSYFKDIEASAENRFFVQALTEIAHGLDLTVVAESVETENTWQLLPTLKVDAGQGYYLARPS
jgi:EAL domain-containing protein (putative c-di-GMP-specific phosphodiesterase class I)